MVSKGKEYFLAKDAENRMVARRGHIYSTFVESISTFYVLIIYAKVLLLHYHFLSRLLHRAIDVNVGVILVIAIVMHPVRIIQLLQSSIQVIRGEPGSIDNDRAAGIAECFIMYLISSAFS